LKASPSATSATSASSPSATRSRRGYHGGQPKYLYASTLTRPPPSPRPAFGDSYVDISSEKATGPSLRRFRTPLRRAPSIEDVIRNSDVSLDSLNALSTSQASWSTPSLQKRHRRQIHQRSGLYDKISKIADNLDVSPKTWPRKGISRQLVATTLSTPRQLGRRRLNNIVADLNAGKGTAASYSRTTPSTTTSCHR